MSTPVSPGPELLPGHRPPEPLPEPPRESSMEDAGSVALSEALRSSFLIVRILLGALVIYFLVSNVRSISSQERAIVLRFGQPVMREGKIEQGPGLVWAFPYPIDEVVRIPVAQLLSVRSTVGWYAQTAAQEAEGIVPDAGQSLNPAFEGFAITGDGNIIHSRALVRYRITDPVKYYLNHANGAAVLTNIVDNALTMAAAEKRVDDVLRREQVGFKELVLRRVRELVEVHDLGITIEQSDIQSVPPRQLKADFDQVLTAVLERDKAISDAQAYSSRVVNEGSGEARVRVNQGEADRNRLVQAVSAEAQSFSNLLPGYQRDPEFFRRRLQAETLRRIMTNAQQKFTLPAMSGRDQLWLHLNREPEKPVKAVLPP